MSGHWAVVIPAYRAGRHLETVLSGVSGHVPLDRVYVVDDGSDDDTSDIARRCGAVVIAHETNRGKGAALDTGIRRAADDGFSLVVTLDADGQHNPGEIPALVACAESSGADIVVGDRLAHPVGMPWLRLWTNRVTSGIISALARARVNDSQNGFRVIRTDVYCALGVRSVRYEAESELLIRAGRSGARIVSAPVETIYADEVSAIHPLVDTGRFLRLVWRSMFW